LNAEGNAFAKLYYDVTAEQGCLYFDDYERTLVGDLPSLYYVEDTWQNYDRIAEVISQRFDEWKRKS
jgi:quinol monooxygenase YgiN